MYCPTTRARLQLSLVLLTIAATTGCSSGSESPFETQAGNGALGGAAAAGGTGGSSSGGSNTGGSTGGSTTGGSSTGGANTGGSTTGGSSTGGATTGGSNTGGSSSGGSDATGGGGPTNMRDIPSTQIVEEMLIGWNLGNTLDADPGETAWGNPLTTQAMISAVHAAGFGTVRIPVTWGHHIGGPPDYPVDAEWMARVEEVANYVLSTGMYAIINTHHDEWVSVMPSANHDEVANQLGVLWTQIATRFRDYGDHLVFETLNEPRTRDDTEWIGGTPEARAVLNSYNLAAVNAIRATGGNNAIRHIMIPTHAANPSDTTINDLQIPNSDPKIIVSLHTYYPNAFSFGNGDTSWGDGTDRAEMEAELDRIYNLLPATGRAVVIGEWGSVHQNNTADRARHAETYAQLVTERGMCPIWWDNGAIAQGADGFGLLVRSDSPPGWAFPEIVTGLIAGATAGAAAR